MESLNQDWITEKHTDFEYKKYVLLGFLKKIADEFEAQRIYPALELLEFELQRLLLLKNALNLLEKKLSKGIKSIDIHNFKLVYQTVSEDDKSMLSINQILDFSIPLTESLLQKGLKKLAVLEQKMAISPIGISPLVQKEGYLFLSAKENNQTNVYSYQVTIFENSNVNYPGVHTQFIDNFQKSISCTYEFIKHDLIKSNHLMPNPATFLVACDENLPIECTFLPIAKLKLSKFIH
ncbi:MAG TPA: hypothetical protein PK323_14760 [Bacteroidia bacterium]|nr:hypothetical protein [Bacteroidia bacterium]